MPFAIAASTFASILPGGCLPPHITPTLPVEPPTTGARTNCWDPRTWGAAPVETTTADAQAIAGAAQLV